MANEQNAPLERLWKQYAEVFQDFDDLTLARWMAQTLGQLKGRVWRLSHPLVGAYRLAAETGYDRGLWLKRLATIPAGYVEAPCCRAPLLPLLTRDVVESGLVCEQCGGTAVEFSDFDPALQEEVKTWAAQYAPVHQVAHWDETMRARVDDYEAAMEEAAGKAEHLLAQAGSRLAPRFLELYPAIVWEDHDECLEVKPEDVPC
ncbi:MAG: hypothetical protein NTW03_15650 [Verrucomicrobia bacterium]|nr:hypothetical protein [Verrucomicrobiota bacterium]